MVGAETDFMYLVLCVTSCGQVELVALVGELSDTLDIYGLEAAYNSVHIKAQKVVLIALELLALCSSLSICLVHLRASHIVLGNRCHLEVTAP